MYASLLLSQTFTYSGTSGSFGVCIEKEDKRPPFTVEELDSYALERWEVSTDINPLKTIMEID